MKKFEQLQILREVSFWKVMQVLVNYLRQIIYEVINWDLKSFYELLIQFFVLFLAFVLTYLNKVQH